MSRIPDKSSVKVIMLYVCLILGALQLTGCGSREQSAQSYYEKGISYLKKEDYIKAHIELMNAVQLKENMVEAWRALAEIDEHFQDWASYSKSLRRIVEIEPNDIAAKARLAKLLLLAGVADEALKMTNAALELDPQNADILALKAGVLFRLKDTDGAIRTAQKALEIDPGNADANVVLAVQKFLQHDFESALKILSTVTDARKDDIGVAFLKIFILESMGDLAQVESLLQKLIELYPNEPAFRDQLIRFYVAHKRQDDAIKFQRTVVAGKPDDSNAELGLINLLGALKGPAAARTELVGRINVGGRVFPYQLALAKLDFAQGNVADSTKLLHQLIGSANSPDDVLTARTTLAEMYLSNNNVAGAEPVIADILDVDDRNINGLKMRAAIRMDQGRIDDAIADLRTALNDQPRSFELLVNLAIAYERNGSTDIADKVFSEATKASGYAPAVGLSYVAFLRRRGLNEHADNLMSDLVNFNPNNIAILSALGDVKLAHQDWIGAHEVADAIRRLNEKSDIANQISAAAFSGEKKFDDSLAILKSAYAANPGAVQPMTALVGVYLESKQIDKAEAFIAAALKANPENAEALVLMGSIALAKNNQNEAMTNFEAAIKRQPKDIIGYRALADLYVRQKKNDEAMTIIRAGLEQQPQSFALELTLAGLLEAKGEFEPAIAQYESMLKEQPGSMIVANNLATLLSDHRTDKASWERANSVAVLLTKSQIPEFKDTVGWVAYRRGDYRAAISLLEAAVAELSNVSVFHYHLGMSYLATGQDAKASEQFSKARELAPNDAELKTKIEAALKSQSEKTKDRQ